MSSPKRPVEYSTAEALAQFALELDGQRATPAGQFDEAEAVFTRETRDLIVVEAARILVADGLTIRGE